MDARPIKACASLAAVVALIVVVPAAQDLAQSGRIDGKTYTNTHLRLTYNAPVELNEPTQSPKLLFVDDGSTLLAFSVTMVGKRAEHAAAILLSAKAVPEGTTPQQFLRQRYASKQSVRLTGKPEKRELGGCAGAKAMSRVKVDKKNWRGSHFACVRDGYAVELTLYGSDEAFHFVWEQQASNIRFQ